MTNEEILQQAEAAARAFNNQHIQDALEAMKGLIAARMWQQASSESGGTPSERLCAMAWAVQAFESYFAILIEGGELAANEIEQAAKAHERAEHAIKRMKDYGTHG